MCVGSWPSDPATPGTMVYILNVCCTPMCERKNTRESVNTDLLFLPPPPHLFRQISSNMCDGRRWHGAACCGNHRWLVVRGELSLRPLSFSTGRGAPCGAKRAFALFPGLVMDAGCAVASGGLCGCRTHHNVNKWEVELHDLLGKCDILSCKTAAGIKASRILWLFCKIEYVFQE